MIKQIIYGCNVCEKRITRDTKVFFEESIWGSQDKRIICQDCHDKAMEKYVIIYHAEYNKYYKMAAILEEIDSHPAKGKGLTRKGRIKMKELPPLDYDDEIASLIFGNRIYYQPDDSKGNG